MITPEDVNKAAMKNGLAINLEPDSESKEKWLPVSVTTTLRDEEVYVGYFNISKKSKLYIAMYDLVIAKYPTILWEEKKEKIIASISKYLSSKGFSMALLTSMSSEEKEEIKEELEDFVV